MGLAVPGLSRRGHSDGARTDCLADHSPCLLILTALLVSTQRSFSHVPVLTQEPPTRSASTNTGLTTKSLAWDRSPATWKNNWETLTTAHLLTSQQDCRSLRSCLLEPQTSAVNEAAFSGHSGIAAAARRAKNVGWRREGAETHTHRQRHTDHMPTCTQFPVWVTLGCCNKNTVDWVV